MKPIENLGSFLIATLSTMFAFLIFGKDVELYHIFYVMVFSLIMILTQIWFIADREAEK